MAPNRRFEQEAPVSSSEEEEEVSSEANDLVQEESDSEEEDKTSPPRPPKDKRPSALKKPEITQTSAQPQSSSSDGSGSESDSYPDSLILPSRRADHNIKPIASKPMEETPKATKKARSKPSALPSATAVKASTATKRPVDNDNSRDAKDSKRPKRKASHAEDGIIEEDAAKKTGDDTKKQLFQRLWSEEDEIAVLKGMIEYTAKKGADPVAEMNVFHDFIKNKLHIDVSKTQLSDKVRRLKKKYENNASKGKKGGERNISKPHEQKAYELSKKIWGGEANCVGVGTKVNGKENIYQNQRSSRGASSPKVDSPSRQDGSKEVSKMEFEQNARPTLSVRLNRSIGGDSSLEEGILKDGLHLIEGTQRLELEEKWKQLWVGEVELYLKRIELIRDKSVRLIVIFVFTGVVTQIVYTRLLES
ncbi:hypothetical protein F0562_014147 [Nyssa sinensis]|uniref:Glabrous enhancer-binding protein-like DBD domain-containing protein n=1 Tax=Nyssa sinensis TaxID=561372 RepID=A0A5J4ZM56_9ASTE|nr:hypothetical protein F0562_014147 [Nyssa sinensis]